MALLGVAFSNCINGSPRTVSGCISCLLAVWIAGCGNSGSCAVGSTLNDPSGLWTGQMVRVESDCGADSRGAQFEFEHDVSLQCDSEGDTTVVVYNEDSQEFSQTSYSAFGGGSFTVERATESETINISYDNFEGELSDVTQKIRLYSGGRIVCSELYEGTARR